MTDRHLTDAQIATALRAHLPAHAQAGLRGRVFEQIEVTPQRPPMPSFLSALTDADPVGRRRSILFAAALLIAVAFATAVGVGAYLQSRQPDQLPFSLDPPGNVDAYVTESYPGLVSLPALSLTVIETEGTKTRWFYDGNGHVRMDHYDMPTADEPVLFQLFADDTLSEIVDVGGEQAWVEHPGQGNPLGSLASAVGLAVDCPTPWTYVGLEYVIDRPTHHVACGDSALWLDVETRIPLKSIRAQPVEIGPTIQKDVLELAVGPQPASLFDAPAGIPTVGENEYQCSMMSECVSPAPETPPPTARPILTPPPPAVGDFTAPTDVNAFVADVLAGYATLGPLELTIDLDLGTNQVRSRYVYDASGRMRLEWFYDPNQPPTVYIVTPEHSYESFGLNEEGRPVWQDHGVEPDPRVNDLGLSGRCVGDWKHLGFDLVNDRPAHHLACGDRAFWVDQEWDLVVRNQYKPDPLIDDLRVDEVLDVQFGEPPAGSFDLSDDALICGSRGRDCREMSGEPYHTPSPEPSSEASPTG